MVPIRILVNKALYSPEVLLKSAYMFLDEAYIHFDETPDSWVVELTSKEVQEQSENLTARFENELLSQAVRFLVFKRTATIRKILLARAMTSTLVDDEDPVTKIQDEQQDVSDEELKEILTDWFDRNE